MKTKQVYNFKIRFHQQIDT